MSNDKSEEDKYKKLYERYFDEKNRNFSSSYDKWLKEGVPQPPRNGKMGELMKFFKENFGLNYGEEQKFREIDKQFKKYIESLKNTTASPTQAGVSSEPSKQTKKISVKLQGKKYKVKVPKPVKKISEKITKLSTKTPEEIEEYFNKRTDKNVLKHRAEMQEIYNIYTNKVKSDKIPFTKKDLPKSVRQYIKAHAKEFSTLKYEADHFMSDLNKEDKTKKYKQKLDILESVLLNPKNELEKKKAEMKKQKIKDKLKRLEIQKLEKGITGELDETLDVPSVQLNSYISKKTIPLFLQNPDGSYRRITPDEAQALKNDPSGDYYDGSGIKYKLNLHKVQGGSFIGLITAVPALVNMFRSLQGSGVEQIGQPQNINSTFNNFNQSRYTPKMVMKPFSIGW